MKYLLIIISFFIGSLGATAQDALEKIPIQIKYNLTSILDFSAPYIHLSVEYPIAPKWSLEHEIGYLHNRYRLFSFAFLEDYSGIRLRNQLRYYLPSTSENKKNSLDLHVRWQYARLPDQQLSFSRFQGSFFQEFPVSPQYNDVGVFIGYSRIFYEIRGHILFELGAAMGVERSFFTYGNDTLPDDATPDTLSDINFALLNQREDLGNLEGVIFRSALLLNFKMGVFF